MKEIDPAEDSASINRTRSKSQTTITFTAEPLGSCEETIRNFTSARIIAKNEICFVQKKEGPTFSRGIFYERLNS